MQIPRFSRTPVAVGPLYAAQPVLRPAVLLLAGLVCGALVAGCASTRTASNPAVGTWAYVISGTDLGDVSGTLDLAMMQDALSGQLQIEQLGQTVPIEDIRMEGDRLMFGATIQYQGQSLDSEVDLRIDGDAIEGTLGIPAYNLEYPVTGTRQAN